MEVATHCKLLQSLDISFADISEDAAVSAIAKGCPDLRNLNLSHCFDITDAGVVEFLQNCRLLRVLNLSDCNHLSLVVLNAAVLYGNNLRKISLGECIGIDSFDIENFQLAKPDCFVRFQFSPSFSTFTLV